MIRQSFNSGWTAGAATTGFAAALGGGGEDSAEVTLPHDVVRDLPRDPNASDGANNGYFPGGYFRYAKTFDVHTDYRHKVVLVEFEGVYRDAVVYVNGEFAAQRPSGYSGFSVEMTPFLRYGQANTITVDMRADRDSRWYTGAGIYRNTHLLIADPVHILADGVRITTPDIEADLAVVNVDVTVHNEERLTRTVRVNVDISGADGAGAAAGAVPLTLLPGTTATARLRLYVQDPSLWNVDAPHVYTARTILVESDETLDSDTTTFGIRRLQLDPFHGLRINGETVKLRGACIHHDNGPLGAATISRADERRIEILKDAGFNAVRSSHNTLSRAALDACDRLGMLVMDESFDVWTEPKTAFDYSLAFPQWWERDIEAMVAKDFNHPSVVMYSIGNEIFENGSGIGATWGRRLAAKVRELDSTRFVTTAVNGLVAALDELPAVMGDSHDSGAPADVNSLMAAMGDVMNEFGASQLVSQKTEETHAALDIAGLNYADRRYVADRTDYPNRIIVGTETFPGHIDVLWHLVKQNSHVLGDFTWTGWDYLGEAGLGRTDYPDENYASTGVLAPYPALTAGCADIDITGFRKPISYYRETVYGLRQTPYIAVHRPEFHGRETVKTSWSWADAVSSWSFDVSVGSPVTIDVYSDADEVELTIDGQSVARVRVGQDKAYTARFEYTYQPGDLTAIAYCDGLETGRSSLSTAGATTDVRLIADRDQIRSDDTDLAYVTIELHDGAGNVVTHRDRPVAVEVSGPAVLAGLGTGRSITEERFGDSTCTTFDGRAMAIIRPTAAGKIALLVRADGCAPATTTIQAH
jgi:beta-galactosidase/beta-glucuronidase